MPDDAGAKAVAAARPLPHGAAADAELIEEHGLTAVAPEADWPDAHRVACCVRGASGDGGAAAALFGFDRFPRWWWRNAGAIEFTGWLGSPTEGAEGRE